MTKVAALLAVSLLAAACGALPGRHVASHVRVGSVELHVPAGWSVRRLPPGCFHLGPGVLATNLDARSFAVDLGGLPPGACPAMWELHGAPRDIVLVDVSEEPAGPAPSVPDSSFPVRLARRAYVSPVTREPLCDCRFEVGEARVHGLAYLVRVWTGPRVPASELAALDALIGSIRPSVH